MVDRGWRDYSTRDLRVAGVDAPERTTRAGKLVAECVRAWCSAECSYWLVSDSLDKYGRVLGELEKREPCSDTLSSFLIRNGLARRYEGGSRYPWTLGDLVVCERRAEDCLNVYAAAKDGSGSDGTA